MEQLIILLIIGGITLAKWLIEKSAELREKKKTQQRIDRLGDGEEPEAPPHPGEAAPEEAVRKFLEALGLPPESAPPERPVPPIVAQPPPIARFVEPEPKPEPRPLVVQAADLERRLIETKKLASNFARRTAAREPVPSSTVAGPSVRLDQLLRTRGGLRQAVLVSEILGPPKGLTF